MQRHSCRRHARRPVLRAIAFCAGLAAAAARADSAAPLRLDEVLDAARQANPQIHIARQRAAALSAVPAQVSAYDDPTLSWEAWDVPESLRIDAADNNIFRLAQKLPFPGKRTLAGSVAERSADAAHESVRATELDVAAAVKRAYYDLWLTHQKHAILTRDKLLVERLARTVEEKYGVGEATQAEALRAQVELTHLVIEVSSAVLARETAAAELNALLSRRPDEPLGVPEVPAMAATGASLDSLTELALQRRPELAAQRAVIAGQQDGVELAGLGWRPDFEVSVGRFINYGRSDGFGAMATMTLPFVQAGKYEAASAEARAELAAAESELRRWQDIVRREVAQAYARAQTAALQHGLARGTHIPQAEQAMRVTEGAYESGYADFVALLDTLRNVETIHLQHVEAEAELARANADLERAVGAPLPEPVAIAAAAGKR